MSRGLGSMERKVMDIVTYPNAHNWINIREIIQIIEDVEPPVYDELKGMSFNEKIEFLCCYEGHFLYCRCRLVPQNREGMVFYQSLMRAIRSLEKKGFIVSRLENVEMVDKEELREVPPTKEISFNRKCLINGVPWQLKYLNKRLKGLKGV